MSRSNPTAESTPNPTSRWLSWGGSDGTLSYYDKEQKKDIPVPIPFTFILLDQLATMKGWSDRHGGGIVANEVRDIRNEPLTVKVYKDKKSIPLAEGYYSEIKDSVKASGGYYVANLYVAYKEGNELKLGSVQFKRAALNAWVDFANANKSEIYSKAIIIDGSADGQKGAVKFKTPTFKLKDISAETNEEATELDRALQTYLTGYLKRTKVEHSDPRVDAALEGVAQGERFNEPTGNAGIGTPGSEEDPDIPFSPNVL